MMMSSVAAVLLLVASRVSAWSTLSLPSQRSWTRQLAATVAPEDATIQVKSNDQLVLETIEAVSGDAHQYADDFGLTHTEAAVYAVFSAIRKANIPLGLKGAPFVLRRDDITKALGVQEAPFDHFFTLDDFRQAVQDDFLDAARGSTDNRKGWKITNVSTPRGESFEEARMTFEEVQQALDKGTVILNAIGAHVPKLAAPSLACTDATALPNAINLYVTDAGQRTSAPPHTDRQDVVVVQTSGAKHWRVFQPTDPARKPSADMLSRGKGDDNLPLHGLLEANDINSAPLLIETVLNMGDILFIPAAFPHTTSTANTEETSVHLTFNIDTHIWELDYLSARRLALQRSGVTDVLGGTTNPYVGKVNELPPAVLADAMTPLPLGLLQDEADLPKVAQELKRISLAIDSSSSQVDCWEDTITRLQQQGKELLETHRDMYLAAIQEGRTREAEDAMTAHLKDTTRHTMSPERMQRLSLFRVKKYYEQIDQSKKSLLEWAQAGSSKKSGGTALPADWAFTLPIQVGDQVEADLGGAFFDATVTRVATGNKYDVQFFDGDQEVGLDRGMLKLKTPPKAEEEVDTSNMTPKQLKRWRKEQKKKQK